MTFEIQTGAPVNVDTGLYVERPHDEVFLDAIKKKDWINIYGPRAMGKSSLYHKHLRTLENLGMKTVHFMAASRIQKRPSGYQWVCSFGEEVFRKLGYPLSHGLLQPLLDLGTEATVALSLECLMKDVLQQINMPLLLVLDEFHYIKHLEYCNDILIAFRDLRENKEVLPYDLTFCFVGIDSILEIAEAGTPAKTPFMTPIKMLDFQQSKKNRRSFKGAFDPETCPDEAVFSQILDLSGGQPYVTMLLLEAVKETGCTTSEAVTKIGAAMLADPESKFSQLCSTIEKDLLVDPESSFDAVATYERLLKDPKKVPTTADANVLLRSGLVKTNGRTLEAKGHLFKHKFDLPWIETMYDSLSSRMFQRRGSTKSKGKKICIINAGGTLGMIERGKKVVAPRNATEYRRYFNSLDSIAETVEFVTLFEPRDSINIFPDQWIKIARYIFDHKDDGFAGFVVVHGTDTMAFSASAVAFSLGKNLTFPVVFTGSQTTPDVAHGDAHVNLYRACEVAKVDIPEVVISFGNFVYRAVRSQKKDDRRFEGFESPTYPPLAEITGEINVRTELLRLSRREREYIKNNREIELHAEFKASIMLIQLFPGLEPEYFDQYLNDEGEKQCHGVILQTLGAGNVTSEFPFSFIHFVKRASEKGIPVVITSQYPPDPGAHTKYAPAEAPLKAGGIHAGNMTLPAAIAKFQWVLAKVNALPEWQASKPKERLRLVKRLMVKESLVGEF